MGKEKEGKQYEKGQLLQKNLLKMEAWLTIKESEE